MEPAGGHTRARRWVLAVTLVCGVALLLGWGSKARCLLDGGWSDGEQYTEWCYTDVYPLWFAERLDEGALPYRDHPVEYPVLTGAQMWAVAQVVDLLPTARPAVAFFHGTAALGAGAALATLGLLVRAGLSPQRLLWWAAAPTLVLTAFVNWDPVPVALLTAAVVAHQRGRDGIAGVAAGLGAAAKLFPAILVPVVVATRVAQRRVGDGVRHAGAAAAAWLLVNVPVAVAAPQGWRRFFDLNRERSADWDSLWFLAEQVRDQAFAVEVINAASAGLFLAGGLGIAVIGARARDAGDWWQLALPLLAWFLVTNKVYSPQFSLWLLPLAALALPRVAPFLAFLAADAAVFAVRFPHLGGVQGFEPTPDYPWFAAAVAVRAATLLWMIAVCLEPRSGSGGDRCATATTGTAENRLR